MIYYRTSIVSKDKRTTIRNEMIRFRISLNGLKSEFRAASCHEMHPEKREEGAYNGISIRVESLSVKIVTRAGPFAANEKIISFQASTELSGSRFNFADLLVISIRPQNTRQHPFPISPSFPSSSLPFRCPSLDRNRSSFYSASLNFP